MRKNPSLRLAWKKVKRWEMGKGEALSNFHMAKVELEKAMGEMEVK